jgi:hypothetical protein
MQIDHSFIIGDVLILLEAKLQGKRIDYYLTAEGFEDRVKDRVIEKWLNNRDRKLRDHHALVARAWAAVNPAAAIYIICASDVEYIPSLGAEYWLDRHRDIPRVCTPNELLDWLGNINHADLVAHPATVRLRD